MVARSGRTGDGFRWTLAPALATAWDEIEAAHPDRPSQPSDGTIASAAHSKQNPTSDHEADRGDGYVKASDFGDTWPGWDPDDWLDAVIARRDPRVKYIIKDRKVWRSYRSKVTSRNRPVNDRDVVTIGGVRYLPAWKPAHYPGSNPHESHAHLSTTDDGARSTAPWGINDHRPPPEDDVTPQDIEAIAEEVTNRVVLHLSNLFDEIDKALADRGLVKDNEGGALGELRRNVRSIGEKVGAEVES